MVTDSKEVFVFWLVIFTIKNKNKNNFYLILNLLTSNVLQSRK